MEKTQNKPVPAKLASKVNKACLERGMLILTTSVFETIRAIPPLNITEAELQEGLDIFKESLESVAASA